MNLERCVEKFLLCFPEYQPYYYEHIKDYGKILGHIFFGDCINIKLVSLLKENEDIHNTRKYISFVEEMFENGDDAIRNIVDVTILEYLGDDDMVLQNAYSYFSENLVNASKMIENQIGRR